MIELTAESARDYLIASGRIAESDAPTVRELAGGVSNLVLLVELTLRTERFVLKQARGRLRVKEEWLCPIERIWREVETLRICGDLLAASERSEVGGQKSEGLRPYVPHVLWEDRGNYCFAMTAAPPEHKTWKELLLAGELASSGDIAATCGKMLGAIHGVSWGQAEIAAQLDDRSFFEQLRIDPYYRHITTIHPDLAPQIQRLIDSVWLHRRCLVHGDFSPKNLLIWNDRVMLIDCEVGHYGDPAFDLGFFLTHLFLKAIRQRDSRSSYLELVALFWNCYCCELSAIVFQSELEELERRAAWNLAGCLLARVDGKSTVDYLTAAKREAVRELSRRWLVTPPESIAKAAAVIGGSTPC
jgi:hypothetical protein